jgi:flagellar biosynthesis/type III secretory pathway protein FliH
MTEHTGPWDYPVDDIIETWQTKMNGYIEEAYKKGLGDGWFLGYDQGYEDGADQNAYEQKQNPYRSDDDQ